MRMRLLLLLFDRTIEHEKLDWLTNIVVWLGGKKNYDAFYRLPH